MLLRTVCKYDCVRIYEREGSSRSGGTGKPHGLNPSPLTKVHAASAGWSRSPRDRRDVCQDAISWRPAALEWSLRRRRLLVGGGRG
jgi:hypothetical protein